MANDNGIRLTGNHVFGVPETYGAAFNGPGTEMCCIGNTASGFSALYQGCEYSRDNTP